jgi:hypothetical protein
MQPSRRHCLFASLALLAFFLPARAHADDSLTITSTPAGATVEIDGAVVGTTPYHANFPGGYFHKTHTVFSSRLDHAMILRVSLEGYAPQQINMTDGPFEWIAVTGRHQGSYFLLKSKHFDLKLAAPAQTPSRNLASATHTGPLSGAPPDYAENQDTDETGSVLVTSETEAADIYADGNFVGETPSTIKLAIGAHRIEVRATGQTTWSRNLDVLKGSKITLRAIFPQQVPSANPDPPKKSSPPTAATEGPTEAAQAH